jgi:hypothetical protein
MRPKRAKRICAKIQDEAAFEACVFDAIVTGDKGTGKAYLKTLKLREAAL